MRHTRKKSSRQPAEKLAAIDYTNLDLIKENLNDLYKLAPARATGFPSKYQRKLALAVARARYLALIPYTERQT